MAGLHVFLLPLPVRFDVRRVCCSGTEQAPAGWRLVPVNGFVCQLTLVKPAPDVSCVAVHLGCWLFGGRARPGRLEVGARAPKRLFPRSLAAGCQDTSWDYQPQTLVWVPVPWVPAVAGRNCYWLVNARFLLFWPQACHAPLRENRTDSWTSNQTVEIQTKPPGYTCYHSECIKGESVKENEEDVCNIVSILSSTSRVCVSRHFGRPCRPCSQRWS